MPRWLAPILAGVLAAVLCLWAVAWADRRQTSHRRQDLEGETRVVALQLADRLKSSLEKCRLALEQTASFHENSESVTEQEFDDFASTTFRLLPGCARIVFVDEALRLFRVYPHEAYRHLVGFDLHRHPEGLALLREAREAGEAVLSPPVRLLDGSEGFALVVPAFSRGKFLGEVVGAFRTAEFFSTRLVPELLERYQVTVRSSGRMLFESVMPTVDSSAAPPVFPEAFTVARNRWAVEVRPRPDLNRAAVRSERATLWVLGGLLALAASVGAAFAAHGSAELLSRMRSQRHTHHENPEPGLSAAGDAELSPQVPASRILVVDDEDSMRELLVEVLASDGHRVETASDVPEALEKIAAERFDVVVSDMKMPSGSGREVYRAMLEKDPRLAGRVVFTTGAGATGDTVRFVRETGNEVVLKPFRLEDLEAAIARTLLDETS